MWTYAKTIPYNAPTMYAPFCQTETTETGDSSVSVDVQPCIIPTSRDVHTGSDKRRHGDLRPLAISNEKPAGGRAKGLLLTSLNFRGKQRKQPPIPAHYDHDASLF